MQANLDLRGRRFGKLTALDPVSCPGRPRKWVCSCDCGGTAQTLTNYLLSGHTKSCGCLMRNKARANGLLKVTHGEGKAGEISIEYRTWSSMLSRCRNTKDPKYKNYGARGIQVCPEWLVSYPEFLADMGRRPSSEHSLDRIDNSQGYRPDNCRWVTQAIQANNKRTNRHLQLGPERLTISQWAERLKINRSTIDSRLSAGWSIEKSLKTAPRVKHPLN